MNDKSSTKPVPKIFISATTGDLGSVRDIAAKALQRLGCLAVEQTAFGPDYRTIEGHLRQRIAGCDAVIQFVGHRYGAEPDPKARSANEPRRSYTQMEYDIARHLKKKIYLFMCEDDFPYDECEPEEEEKKNLQIEYRRSLRSDRIKKDKVRNSAECESQVLQLQLQIEDLIAMLQREKKRRSLITIAAALIGIFVFASLYSVSRQVNDMSGKSAKGMDGINQQLREMVDLELLAKIAERSEVDPLLIRQALAQFGSQTKEKDILNFSRKLTQNGRPEVSGPLMKFVAEVALSSKKADFLLAAEAFLEAANAAQEQIINSAEKNNLQRLSKLRLELAQRGVDAFNALGATDKGDEAEVGVALVVGLAEALQQQIPYVDLRNKELQISKAIKSLDQHELPSKLDEHQRIEYYLCKSKVLLQSADFYERPEEKLTLARALDEARKAKMVSDQLGDDQYIARSTRGIVCVLRRMAQTASWVEFNRLVGEIGEICSSSPVDESRSGWVYLFDVHVMQLGMILDLSCLTIVDAEKKALLDDADKILRAIEGKVSLESFDERSMLYREQLIRHRILGDGRYGEYEGVFRRHAERGFTTDICEAEVFVDWLGQQRLSDPGDFDPTIEFTEKVLARYPRDIFPSLHYRIRILLSKLYWWRASCRLSEVDLADISKARRLFNDMLDLYDRSVYPAIWVSSRVSLALIEANFYGLDQGEVWQAIEALKEAERLVSKESEPYIWASVHRAIAETCMKADPFPLETAISAIESALQVYTEERVPKANSKLKRMLSEIRLRKK